MINNSYLIISNIYLSKVTNNNRPLDILVQNTNKHVIASGDPISKIHKNGRRVLLLILVTL